MATLTPSEVPPEDPTKGGGSIPQKVLRFLIKIGNTVLRCPSDDKDDVAAATGGCGDKEKPMDGAVPAKRDGDKGVGNGGGGNNDTTESVPEDDEKNPKDGAVSGKSTDEEKSASIPDEPSPKVDGAVSTLKRNKREKKRLFDKRKSTEEEGERTNKKMKKKKKRSMFSFALTDEEIAGDMAALAMLLPAKRTPLTLLMITGV